MEMTTAVTHLAALAHETRLGLFRRLVVAGPDGLTPGELAATLSLAPATLSFHLKELNRAGLIRAEQTGRSISYRADFSSMAALLAYLTENCCAGKSCELSTACASANSGAR